MGFCHSVKAYIMPSLNPLLMWAERDREKKRDRRGIAVMSQTSKSIKAKRRCERYHIISSLNRAEYPWKKQTKERQKKTTVKLLPAEYKDTLKHWNQDRWTVILTTAKKALWCLYYVAHVFRGDKWDLCNRMSFWREEKQFSKDKGGDSPQKIKDMSGSISLNVTSDFIHQFQCLWCPTPYKYMGLGSWAS